MTLTPLRRGHAIPKRVLNITTNRGSASGGTTVRNASAWVGSPHFGVEIETVGLSPNAALEALPPRLKARAGDIAKPDYSTWKVERDNTLSDPHHNAELISPPMKYEDIDGLKEAVKALGSAGARADESTSVHFHIDTRGLGVEHIVRLVRLIGTHEPMIYGMLGVQAERERRFCRPLAPSFLHELQERPPQTREELGQAWWRPFFETAGSSEPEALTRRRARQGGVNLNSLYDAKQTVELRYFEGSLNPHRVQHYADLVHGLVALASSDRPLPQAHDAALLLDHLGITERAHPAARKHFLHAHALRQWVNMGVGPERLARQQAAQQELDKTGDA